MYTNFFFYQVSPCHRVYQFVFAATYHSPRKLKEKKKKKHQKHLFCGNISWVLITLFEVSLQKRRMRHWTQKELNSQRRHFFFLRQNTSVDGCIYPR